MKNHKIAKKQQQANLQKRLIALSQKQQQESQHSSVEIRTASLIEEELQKVLNNQATCRNSDTKSEMTQSSAQPYSLSLVNDNLSPTPTIQEKGQHLIQRGSIVISNSPLLKGRFNRRMSTFSNLPIETRLGSSISVAELLNSIEGKQENTFRLEPIKGVPNTGQLKTYVQDLISKELADFSGTYSAFTAKYYVKILAETVKQEIKDKIDSRYKIVCLSSIGENNGQDLRIKSNFLWDGQRDRYFDVDLALTNGECQLFIVLKVFLIYFD